jgi:ABC-type transporter Mla subunit MlaD
LAEIRQAITTLIHKCAEIASTVNNDHCSFLSYQGTLGATQEKLAELVGAIKEIQQYLTDSRTSVEERFLAVETAGKKTACALATSQNDLRHEFSEALATLQLLVDDHTLIIFDAKKGSEYSAEALLKANDGQKRLDILEKLVLDLQAENKTLKAQCETIA